MTATADGHAPPPWPPRFRTRPGADTTDSRDRLGGLCRELWATIRLVAASTLDVPQFEVKLALAEALFTLTDVAATVEERISELAGQVDRSLTTQQSGRLAAALDGPADHRLPVLVHHWYRPLVAMLSGDRFDPVLDGPSERVRRRGLRDVEDAFTWIVEVAGPEQTGAPAAATDAVVERPCMGARDARFTLFEGTRDYRKAADWTSSGSPYQDDLIELLRVNRDEIDALETFALALFDLIDETPLEVLRHLARLAWDEARHSASGHALLAERGDDPFGYECSMIGIRLRGSMHGWDAWAQITLFGELGIIGPMRRLEREARRLGDQRTAAAFSFICRDEATHLRRSRDLLERFHPAGGLVAAGEAARHQAGALLEQLGLVTAEQFVALDERQIFELLGE